MGYGEGSISTFAADNHPNGAKKDGNIQGEGVVLHIVQVVLGVEMHRFIATTGDLPPAGNAGGNGEAGALPELVVFYK